MKNVFSKISDKIKKLFRPEPWYQKQSRQAFKLIKKLLALRLVQIVLIAFVLLLISPLILFLFLRPQTPETFNYGITFSNKYAYEIGFTDWPGAYLQILDDLKPHSLRLVAYWDESEPQRDVYDFSTIKWQIEEAAKRDIDVILITGRKQVRWPECFEPQWWEDIESEATRDAELNEFVKQSILELRDYDNIVMWQVENEPFWAFGDCAGEITWEQLNEEVEIVRELDDRPIVIQDSGEGGVWLPTYKAADYLAISMYRRIWYDFWGVFLGRPIYFQYPLAHWTYKIKAELVGVPYENVLVTELQAEPWGPGINSELSREEKDKTMSRELFIDTVNYAQKSGFSDIYFWGAEWWLFEKEFKDEPFFWDTAKALFRSPLFLISDSE